MRLEWKETIPTGTWETFLNNSKFSYLFHTPMWARLQEETYGYKTATRLFEVDGLEYVMPMMRIPIMKLGRLGLNEFQSIPEGYGGLFPAERLTSDVMSAILKSVVGGRTLLFTMNCPPFLDIPLHEDAYLRIRSDEYTSTHILPLEREFERVWSKFNPRTRSQCRQAERYGVEIRDAASLDEVHEYYAIYCESTKRWGYDQPPDTVALYENLFGCNSPHVKFKLALLNDRVVAGAIHLGYGVNVFGFRSAVREEDQKYRPVQLLYKELIEEACTDGYTNYNMDSCWIRGSGHLSGVQKLKESFGAEKVQLKAYHVRSRLMRMAGLIPRLKQY